jgi:rod shape-determining protein MreD
MNERSDAPSALAAALFIVLLLIAAALQSVLAIHVSLLGGEPDFLLTLAAAAALLSDASAGALTGFGAGLVTASLIGQTMGTYLVSRTLACWMAGWTTARLYRGNAFVVIVGVFLASLISEAVYLLAAPRVGLGHGLKASLIGSVWNAVLAWPAMLLLRRCGWGTRL